MTNRRRFSSQSESCFGMSEESFSTTSTKNDLEKWKLMNQIYQLQVDEKLSRSMTVKKLHKLQDEVTKMIAESCVYKTHSFEKYDPFITSKSDNDKESLSESFSPTSRKSTTFLPSISEGRGELIRSPHRTRSRRQTQKSEDSRESEQTSNLPSITDSPSNDKSNHDDDSEDGKENKDVKAHFNLMSLALSLHGMIMWRQNVRDKKCEKPESRKNFLCRQKSNVAYPSTKHFKEMFPGNCKTYYSMKKFVEKEAENMINHTDSPMYLKRRMKLNNLIQKATIPQFVRRDKTTSAILRDFREFKNSDSYKRSQSYH